MTVLKSAQSFIHVVFTCCSRPQDTYYIHWTASRV